MKKDYEKLGINTKSKYFRRYDNVGLLNNLEEDFGEEIQKYWKEYYGEEIDPTLIFAFYNLTGKKDHRVIPGTIMWDEIIPFFNDLTIIPGYRDKNIYDIIIKTPRAAKTIIKCVRGHYFDHSNNAIKQYTAEKLIKKYEAVIIKPSKTDDGVGITRLKITENKMVLEDNTVSMVDLEKAYEDNYIVQEIIQQHSVLAAPHPSSVNTLRMVTFRWKNEIKYLLAFARFGANNDVKDNAGGGGVCLGIKDNGEFLDIAIDKNLNSYTHHPTTNYNFADLKQVPNYEEFKQFVIDAHKDIIHHDFISWDIAVGVDEKPIFIEANFFGATWLYQLAAQKPLFGELTSEVLQYVRSQKTRRTTTSDKRSQKILRKRINKLKSSNKHLKGKINTLKKQNESLESELKDVVSMYSSIKDSKGYKLTRPIRKLLNKVK